MNRISKHSMGVMHEDTPTILLFRRTARPISASPCLFPEHADMQWKDPELKAGRLTKPDLRCVRRKEQMRVAMISVPIVAETCARRGAGFSRFLQLVPSEGESQT